MKPEQVTFTFRYNLLTAIIIFNDKELESIQISGYLVEGKDYICSTWNKLLGWKDKSESGYVREVMQKIENKAQLLFNKIKE